jgi:hypothetical protein
MSEGKSILYWNTGKAGIGEGLTGRNFEAGVYQFTAGENRETGAEFTLLLSAVGEPVTRVSLLQTWRREPDFLAMPVVEL